MATLDDKLLGEKTHYYCSSSEDEEENSDGDRMGKAAPAASLPPPRQWDGTSSNTGPKGVIQDWQRFKQLEAENAAEKEKERLVLFKKLSLTCSSTLDDERDKQKEQEDDELFLDDAFLQQYVQQRMSEMIAQSAALPVFGQACIFIMEKIIVSCLSRVH